MTTLYTTAEDAEEAFYEAIGRADLDALLAEPRPQPSVQVNGHHAHQRHAGEHRQRQREHRGGIHTRQSQP